MVIVQSQALISGLDKGRVSLVSGGAQIVLFCSAGSFLFLLFFCLLISYLLSSWPVCAASCVFLWFVRSRPRSVAFVSTSSVSDVQILRLLWQYCQTAVQFGLRVDYESYPRGWATAFPPRGCLLRMRREQPVLDRHRPVSNL